MGLIEQYNKKIINENQALEWKIRNYSHLDLDIHSVKVLELGEKKLIIWDDEDILYDYITKYNIEKLNFVLDREGKNRVRIIDSKYKIHKDRYIIVEKSVIEIYNINLGNITSSPIEASNITITPVVSPTNSVRNIEFDENGITIRGNVVIDGTVNGLRIGPTNPIEGIEHDESN